MTDANGSLNPQRILSGLKDFQLRTVEYAFRRMFTDEHPTRRFLVADEVGLGKTLVAQGIIAKAIAHLSQGTGRIDVIYICSNADIARQNMKKLKAALPEQEDVPLPSRITMLPAAVSNLAKNPVNLIPLTPGTSFDLKSNLGIVEERAILYSLLQKPWKLSVKEAAPVLRGNASEDRFFRLVQYYGEPGCLDSGLAASFEQALAAQAACDRSEGSDDLQAQFRTLCAAFRGTPDAPALIVRNRFVGRLRGLLARACLRALQPDIVILDEFQRFKHLLRGEDEASQLAQEVFNYADDVSHARVLLLSATPYKMYTVGHETDEDHHSDFLDTLAFLLEEEGCNEAVGLLHRYKRALYHLDGDAGPARAELARIRDDLQSTLRRVMVRTERLASTADRNGMLRSVPTGQARLEPADLRGYLSLQKLGRLLGHHDLLNYWKAAPYLVTFMDDYRFKADLEEALKAGDRALRTEITSVLRGNGGVLFPWDDWGRYGEIDPANPRLRQLAEETVHAWRYLWMPPSMPYYQPGGPFANPAAAGVGKRLIFSAWKVVPTVVAGYLHYDTERRMLRAFEPDPVNSPEARKKRGRRLTFGRDRERDRLTGMPVLALIYPCLSLADDGDPVMVAGQMLRECGELPTIVEVLSQIQRRVEERLVPIVAGHVQKSGPEDEAWYWAAPLLMDMAQDRECIEDWLGMTDLAARWAGHQTEETDDGEDSHWAAHVERARQTIAGAVELGPPPADLSTVLAQMAIGGPAVSALRALCRGAGVELSTLPFDVWESAAQVGWDFLSLFNQAEAMAMIRGISPGEPYWRRVLEYCVDGGLQSTLDEYAHLVADENRTARDEPVILAKAIAAAFRDVLKLRTSSISGDTFEIDASGQARQGKPQRMRARFAMRFGDERSEDGKVVTRAANVRDAFNSPFWPFVLATTSVGQEGLDFHRYCHSVVHWNLPSNPVDLEQREGRVHRYKNHAVRKNLSARHGKEALLRVAERQGDEGLLAADPWQEMFVMGEAEPRESDITPYWVYTGPAFIERRVPSVPLSRDLGRLEELRRSLTLYRMVFGQPRQEDLLAYLVERLGDSDAAEVLEGLRIDLSAPAL